MKQGFTLPEILVAVMIVAILAAMAVPQYEKAVEKSRKAEVLATLKKLHESKMRMLDSADMPVYEAGTFGLENLDYALQCKTSYSSGGHRVACVTKDFLYRLAPDLTASSTDKRKNAVCAKREGGDYTGTVFVYYGEMEKDADKRFVCKGSYCEIYGMNSTTDAPACS